jgi:Uma2 family endonuclease
VVRSPTTKRITVEEYHRMAEAGVFAPDDRVELLDGEVLELAPIDSRHSGCVNRLTHLFVNRFGDRAVVAVQSPIEVDDWSEPQPDLVLLRLRADFYSEHHGLPPETLLVVEVANTSLRFDLGRKGPFYLARGIPEVWVVDVVRQLVHVLTAAGARVLARGGSLSPQAFPDEVIQVTDILG